MKKATMAKDVGLHQRGGIWYSRILIPKDLQPAYQGKTRLSRSLGVQSHAAAKTAHAAWRASMLAEFEQRRRECNPQPVATITPELAQTIAQTVYRDLLSADEAVRMVPGAADAALRLVHELRPVRLSNAQPPQLQVTRANALAPLPTAQVDALRASNARLEAFAGRSLASGDLGAAKPPAERVARSMGLLIDWQAPEARPILTATLQAIAQATQDNAKRDAGAVIPTPSQQAPMTAATSATAGRSMRDVFEEWKAAKPRQAKAIQQGEGGLRRFARLVGPRDIATLTRADGIEYRKRLQAPDEGIASKTAKKEFDWAKTLLNFATVELEWLPRNPWKGLTIEAQASTLREPWADDEVRVLFGTELFTAYAIPTNTSKAGLDAAYWVPLLLAYTGARLSEVCQLAVADVEDIDGVPCLHIRDIGEGQRVKTKAGIRIVPIHSALIGLGLLDYVEALREAQAVVLFPAIVRDATNGAGAHLGTWFGAYKRELGFTSPGKVLHSFRHTVRSRLVAAREPESAIDLLLGHQSKGSEGARTYTHLESATLRETVEKIRYAGLDLPRVFARPVWTPRYRHPGRGRKKASA